MFARWRCSGHKQRRCCPVISSRWHDLKYLVALVLAGAIGGAIAGALFWLYVDAMRGRGHSGAFVSLTTFSTGLTTCPRVPAAAPAIARNYLISAYPAAVGTLGMLSVFATGYWY